LSTYLYIDTALELARTGIVKDDVLISFRENEQQRDHAAFLQPAIAEMLRESGMKLLHMDAVVVTEGPGSYTGLRVGMASAKGLCYATGLKLVTLNTLDLMSAYALKKNQEVAFSIPMIDARRQEVFTAVYEASGVCLQTASAMDLKVDSFDNYLLQGPVIFSGNGVEKWAKLVGCENIIDTGQMIKYASKQLGVDMMFLNAFYDTGILISAANANIAAEQYAELIYSEPLYVKRVHTTSGPRENA
jgi:tRNA threonylcarbamoyladenosine biosynthesis protein TsaB